MTLIAEPCDLTAAEACAALSDGSLTAEALARSCLDRTAEREPAVQAWEALDPDLVVAEARAADAAGRPGPLHGLPIGVKDIIATASLPTACGSPIYAGTVLPFDAAVVALGRLAGGIVMGKTVTTEFATYHPGKTRNPHAADRTPGGSSSGSAAAVAAGMVPLALGTQTAGSIIRPAAFCGVVGYKPTWGTIEPAGVKTLARSLDTVGVFARTVEDAALYVQAVSGLPLRAAATDRTAPPVIGLCRSPAWSLAEAEMQAAFEDLGARLGHLIRVRMVDLPPDYAEVAAAQERIMAREAYLALAHEGRCHRDQLSPRLLTLLDQGSAVSATTHTADLALLTRLRASFAETIADTPVLVTPSAPGVAPAAVNGTGDPAFNRLWTFLGAPCINVPGLTGASGLPLGVQVVAAPGADRRALSAAAWLEDAVQARGFTEAGRPDG